MRSDIVGARRVRRCCGLRTPPSAAFWSCLPLLNLRLRGLRQERKDLTQSSQRWEHRGRGDPVRCATVCSFSSSKRDRKSTRLNSSHQIISYAVFCLKKKNNLYYSTPLLT